MSALIPITLIGWVPVCFLLFTVFPRRQAVTIGILAAWMFLPPSGLAFRGLPSYTKGSAFCYGILLATLLFSPDRIARLKPSLLDIPAFLFSVVSPIVTSLSNGLGLYDGCSEMNSLLTMWGLPYLIGRAHFDDARSLRELLVGMAIGGLVYIPFCLAEMVVGPILASKIYGVILLFEERLGGWRPRVFMYKGLELGLWMTMCSLCAIWARRCGSIKQFLGISFGLVWLPLLLATTILCRASGSIGLLAMATGVQWLSLRFRQKFWMGLMVSFVLIYFAVRVPNLWDYRPFITFLNTYFSADRAESQEFRFKNEDMLISRAMERPVFGWGGFGRSKVYDETGKMITIVDGLCVLYLGTNGVFGLATFLGIFVLPGAAFLATVPVRRWSDPDLGMMAAATSVCALYVIDLTQNGFSNSVYPVVAGGLASSVLYYRRTGGLEAGATQFDEDCSERAVHEDPTPEDQLADRYIELARSLRSSGEFEHSAFARRHALEILSRRADSSPSDPHARKRRLDCANDLAWLLASRPDPGPGDRGEAAEAARFATRSDPENPTYWNTLALALCRAGDDAGALDAARRSMELDGGGNGYDSAVLALSSARTGRADDAARWLVEARRWRDGLGREDRALNDLIRDAQAVLPP